MSRFRIVLIVLAALLVLYWYLSRQGKRDLASTLTRGVYGGYQADITTPINPQSLAHEVVGTGSMKG
jgi:hypothetical protein